MEPSQKNNCNNCNCNAQPFTIHLKSRKSMRYDISKSTAPAMPVLGKGTECIKILLSQASKDNHEPFVPMFFPVLGAHISGANTVCTSETTKNRPSTFLRANSEFR